MGEVPQTYDTVPLTTYKSPAPKRPAPVRPVTVSYGVSGLTLLEIVR